MSSSQLGGGTRVSEEFRYIDPKPLASASVAQVHRAKLRTGEEVVLKVCIFYSSSTYTLTT